MDCQCCGVPVGEERKYVLFALRGQTKQVALCKGCLFRGNRAPTGSIITAQDVVDPPKLAFRLKSNRADFCKAARDEGWLTQGVPSDAVVIETHYEQALMHNYFVPGQGWKKNVNRTPVECFKRSCANIRDNYPEWLALKAGK